jgi:hypothetical protein
MGDNLYKIDVLEGVEPEHDTISEAEDQQLSEAIVVVSVPAMLRHGREIQLSGPNGRDLIIESQHGTVRMSRKNQNWVRYIDWDELREFLMSERWHIVLTN